MTESTCSTLGSSSIRRQSTSKGVLNEQSKEEVTNEELAHFFKEAFINLDLIKLKYLTVLKEEDQWRVEDLQKEVERCANLYMKSMVGMVVWNEPLKGAKFKVDSLETFRKYMKGEMRPKMIEALRLVARAEVLLEQPAYLGAFQSVGTDYWERKARNCHWIFNLAKLLSL